MPRKREFWEWKHFRNPFGTSPALVALSGEKLVGLRVFLRWSWRSGEREIAAVRAVDTATHPDWQGKGIFSNLTGQLVEQMESEGVCFIFNTPNRSSLPGYLQMGWKRVARIPIWIRPTKPFRWILRVIHPRNNSFSDEGVGSGSLNEMLGQPVVEEFLLSIPDDERYHTARTNRYLRWRYADIPFFSYQARWKSEKNGCALLIFRTRIRKGLQELSLSELLLSQNQSAVQLGRELLDELAHNSGADYIVATAASDTHESAALRLSGFFPLGAVGPVLTARPLNHTFTGRNPLDWSNWRCSLGEMEIF